MRTVLVIGIGAGDPEHLTLQAIRALNRADVFFVTDKGEAARELIQLREAICAQYATERPYRVVEITDAVRDRQPEDYAAAVGAWHEARADAWGTAIRDSLSEDQCGAFLVWGDPSLYDSTLSILERIRKARMLSFETEVVPGITSLQALAARHRITLNRIGGAIQVTTGRRLRDGLPAEADDVAVLLDGQLSFRQFIDDSLDIYWGAYVGMPQEQLISGDLATVADDIARARLQARERHGWIMDAYVLRRRDR